MFLPLEVIDNIVFSFLRPVWESEHRVNNTQWIDGRLFKTNRATDKLGISHRIAFDVEAVCNARLVSLAWYHSATKLLQKHNAWRLDLDSEHSLAKVTQLCINEVGAGRLLPTRDIVRRLRIPPTRTSMAPKRIEYDEVDGRPTEEELLQWPKDSAVAYRRFRLACITDVNGEEARERSMAMKEVYSTLRRFFKSPVHVESFEMALPEASVIHRHQCAESHIFDIIRGLSQQVEYGFQTEAFAYLQDLRIFVPGTYNIKDYLFGMSQTARDRLKNLFIGITDATGAAGCLEYKNPYRHGRGDLDGTDHDSQWTAPFNPPSRLQLYRPNRRYQDNLWEFVSSCNNLVSLGVMATHYLDLRNVKWENASGLNDLSELYLSRVYVDMESILRLLLPKNWDGTAPATVQNLTLEEVKIHQDGGTWCQVTDFLWENCTNLKHLSLSRLSYFYDHARFWRPDETINGCERIIATSSEEDIDSIRRIVGRFLEGDGGIVGCDWVYYTMAAGLGYDRLDCGWNPR
ncbi:unnamed protein product [Clonostachys rosea]|uniref:Uncharacterized protein n=1 Tax=Bionectria ochroleuca TaxID=29856 RepID=A0ABY6UDD2_BIOOC|nr:unnamed protein product [Clonostachys rosea]